MIVRTGYSDLKIGMEIYIYRIGIIREIIDNDPGSTFIFLIISRFFAGYCNQYNQEAVK